MPNRIYLQAGSPPNWGVCWTDWWGWSWTAGGDLTAIRLIPTRANGQPAVAAYLRDGATARAYGIMVLTIRARLIGEITGFADPSLFPLFGLLQQTPWPPGPER